MIDFGRIGNEQVAAFLRQSIDALTMPSFVISSVTNPHWAIMNGRSRAERLLRERAVKGWREVEYDGPSNKVEDVLSWLQKYDGSEGEVCFNSDDDRISISWNLERPATEEELDEAQRFLVENPSPQPTVGPAIRVRTPIAFTEQF